MALISVIIPYYNVESYIDQCLASVVNQTHKALQIILVNDGSVDGSHRIAQTYAEQDSRITIVEQSNQGLSAARNTGLKYVEGDYVFYLDSDDYLEEYAIEVLFKKAVIYKADVVQGNFYYDYKNHLLINKSQNQEDVVYNSYQAMDALLDHTIIMNFAWGKLLKAPLAKSILFPEGKYFEDTLWQTQIIHETEVYVTTNVPILYYLQRSSGISGFFSLRNLDQLKGEHDRLGFIKEHYPKLSLKALAKFNQKIFQFKNNLHRLPINDQLVFERELSYYIKYWELKSVFNMKYFIRQFKYSNKIFLILNKFENKINNKIKWAKIKKQ
jgi:glycosyltransferase involved in cell wall biosynthesis